MPREPKLPRWTDLIAALLRRHCVATFEELAQDIPAYSDTWTIRQTSTELYQTQTA